MTYSTAPCAQSIWRKIFSKKMLICIVFGFSSGLPLYLLINLVAAWLRDSSVNLKDIGLFSLATFPYVWKFLWAPFLDRYDIFRLGRRRSWLILTQIALLVVIALLGFFNPQTNIHMIMFLCGAVALFSATQDIALDAYRREILDDNELGLGNSMFVNAYRIAGMIPGALSLILSDYVSWQLVFLFTALFMLPGIITTLLVKEPLVAHKPRTLIASVVEPFADLIKRKSFWGLIIIILFIFCYKLGDSMATALATPFYMDMGFTKTQIGIVNKSVGLWAMVFGGFAGGVMMLKIGINRALWIFGVGQIVTILGFLVLAMAWRNQALIPDTLTWCSEVLHLSIDLRQYYSFPSLPLLSIVVGAECLGAGLGTACFVAYMCRETNESYAATQLALFTALAAVPRTVCNATTGYIVELVGWESFFILCFALAIPGMIMLIWVAPFNKGSS